MGCGVVVLSGLHLWGEGLDWWKWVEMGSVRVKTMFDREDIGER